MPTNALATVSPAPEGLAVSPAAVERARDFARAATSANTRRAYAADWRHFERWCLEHRAAALPAAPSTVALYLSELASNGFKVATVTRRLAAIAGAHKAAKHQSPRSDANVQAVIKGIRRKLGVAQKQAKPLLVGQLRSVLSKLPGGPQGVRDRALLLLGFAGGFRRSELAGLDVGDIDFGADGLTITIRRSKTDQEGAGRKLGIPAGGESATCPVRSIKAWLTAYQEAAGAPLSGPLFRPIDRHGNVGAERLTDHAVWSVIKRAAGAEFSGHSLRSGLVTTAAKAGKSAHAIMKQTGHKSLAMVQRYIRDAELFEDNAAGGIGL